MRPETLLDLAAEFAKPDSDLRGYPLGAVGIRTDGAIVGSRNGNPGELAPSAHAERRLLRKLDRGSVVYVTRVKRDGSYGLARPCKICLPVLRARGIIRVYYSTDTGYGVIDLNGSR